MSRKTFFFLAKFKPFVYFVHFTNLTTYYVVVVFPLVLVVPLEKRLLHVAGFARDRYRQAQPGYLAAYCWWLVNRVTYLPGRALHWVHAKLIAFYTAIGLWGEHPNKNQGGKP